MSRTLVLRTTDAEGRAYNGFRWPESGPVEAPDWDPTPRCGGGLHGLLWGCGDASLLSGAKDARWLVVAVDGDTVDLSGKVKFPRGEVVHCGDRSSALAYLDTHGAIDKPVVYAMRTAGYGGTATAGDEGTATAGDEGELQIRQWDTSALRYRTRVTWVGEDGIEPDVPYRMDETGRFVRADQ